MSRFLAKKGMSRIDQAPVTVLDRGSTLPSSGYSFNLKAEMSQWMPNLPLVSCLMVTKNRPLLARCSIISFLNQTYPRKELIIVDDGESHELGDSIKRIQDPRIRYVRLPQKNQMLGTLRNLSVEMATGDFVCQWDDDDLSDPLRLEMQVGALLIFGAKACVLRRETLWWPYEHHLAISLSRNWEGSFLAVKTGIPSYPELAKGEDTPIVDHIIRTSRVAILDKWHLYLYVFHGTNTFGSDHFHLHWKKAYKTYVGRSYREKLGYLSARMPIKEFLAALRATSPLPLSLNL
jgi:glycosyltransferase involved in cell wall biosynthesis